MMENYVVGLIFIAVLFCGCVGDEAVPAPQGGVTYTCPEGWSITDEVDYSGVGHYSACEKDGENSTGVFILSWFGVERDLNESMSNIRKDMREGYEEEEMGVEFSEAGLAKFKGNDALVSGYKLSLGGVEYRGKIITFNCNGKSVALISQEAVKDHDLYLEDFESIGNSVDCGSEE